MGQLTQYSGFKNFVPMSIGTGRAVLSEEEFEA